MESIDRMRHNVEAQSELNRNKTEVKFVFAVKMCGKKTKRRHKKFIFAALMSKCELLMCVFLRPFDDVRKKSQKASSTRCVMTKPASHELDYATVADLREISSQNVLILTEVRTGSC